MYYELRMQRIFRGIDKVERQELSSGGIRIPKLMNFEFVIQGYNLWRNFPLLVWSPNKVERAVVSFVFQSLI